MRFLVLLVFSIFFLFLSASFGYSLYLGFDFSLSSVSPFRFEGMGMLIYVVISLILKVFHRNLEFAETFCHELNHTVFCVLSFHKVDSFLADSEKGGKVSFSGNPNPFIVLAPYAFPLFALVALFFKLFAMPKAFPIIEGVVGFFLLFHLHSIFCEAHLRQTDLKVYGYLFSYSAILLVNLILVPFVFIAAGKGFDVGFEFLKNGWLMMGELALMVWRLV
ncbi:MAG: M50 family metallopeptidase [Fibrobacteraceae bacterium]|nr:M50 family metallopeptidase [Fibrobacteraceae bacterium]